MPLVADIRRIAGSSWINILLAAAPLSWWLAWQGDRPTWVFLIAALSLVPAAGLIGSATENLSEHAGPTLGGFLNASFGNAAELIIAIAALRAGHTGVVKASITGSIIGNLLLVFGLSCFVGGFKHGPQKFNRTSAGTSTVMLFLATVALVMPAVLDLVSFGSLQAHPEQVDRLSFWTSIILLLVYGAGLVFSFNNQEDPLRRTAADHGQQQGGTEAKGQRKEPAAGGLVAPISLLAVATLLTVIEAEILMGTLEPALEVLGMTELFAGVIVVAFVGNAAEHYSAVSAASGNQMTLALEISVGSSAQIALMVAPVLVLLSFAFGHPMSLVFNAFEITAIGLSVLAVAMVSFDGESNWLEGLQLLGVYLILALAFYLIPA